MNRGRVWWFLLVLGLAVFLRANLLDRNSLWGDEAYSVRQAEFSIRQIWDTHSDPVHPPLYYLMLHAWIGLFGHSEASVRFPSFLLSLLNIGLVYVLARRTAGREAAMVAASLLALAPLSIWYAAEARMYTLLACLGLLMALGLVSRHRLGRWIYFVALALGLYVSYTIIPLWIVILIIWFHRWWLRDRERRDLVQVLLLSAAAWVCYIPWMPKFSEWLGVLDQIWLFPRVLRALGISHASPALYPLGLGFVAVATFAASIGFSWISRTELFRKRWSMILLIGFGLVVALTPIPRGYAVKRLLAAGWPLLLLVIAWIVVGTRSWRRVWMGLALLSAVSGVVAAFLVPKDDWRAVVAYLNRHATNADLIWLEPARNHIVFDYYQPVHPPGGGPIERLSKLSEGSDRVWFVAERFNGAAAVTPIEGWLDQNRELVRVIPFHRLDVRQYRGSNSN